MTAGDERPLAYVPRPVWAALFVLLGAQVAWQAGHGPPRTGGADLPPAPAPAALRLASFGEAPAASRLIMLYVQAFDLGGGNELPYRQLDYARLIAWLRTALALDPRSEYPLFMAARVYSEIPDEKRLRLMLDFVEQAFLGDPDRRWPWLAHAALLAKHRLHDLPLARRYAAEVDRLTTSAAVPGWARQMEIFILEDLNELEAAKILLGGLLASGKITDPSEARFLKQRLTELEQRIGRQKVK